MDAEPLSVYVNAAIMHPEETMKVGIPILPNNKPDITVFSNVFIANNELQDACIGLLNI